ncbi:MAG: AAA family ATPase, partial [Candidatus Omnitrophica bacterium]|nr:AAA family ATPase [Candidatus Omnitrophota bacterium]
MAKNKFFKYLRYNWKKVLLIFIATLICSIILSFLYMGIANFTNLESFSRKQMMAQAGLFLFIGILQAFIFFPLNILAYYFMFMGGGMAKYLGGDPATRAKSEVKWDDVIGMQDAKRDAWEIVQLLKDSQKVKAIGGSMIKGVLFFGPPGCGKTYLAKAIANEAGLPFLSAVGSEFVGMLVGMGAAKMKLLFQNARKLAEVEGGCIIFIDEIDSFATPRQEERGYGGATSHNATVNQFLTELDGLRKKENNICVMAATNLEPEQLDNAIMRSGRFDRKIYVRKPTAQDRVEIIKYYLSKIKADANIDVARLAEKCQAFSPADISNMVREASLLAMRARRENVTNEDLAMAMEELMVTIEKTGQEEKILSSKTNVRWDDLIGMEETKKDAWEIVELLRDRHKLNAVGGQIIKGVMMIGPPGCGKTYLAKAIATESGFPFIAVTGTDFVTQVWSGTGILRLKKVFKEAREVAKSEGGCIIFIDEIDAFVRPRDPSPFSNTRNSDTSSINEFLTELDGLKGQNKNIIVIAATNVPEDKLDSAVMRSGRFDRKIYFQKPAAREREALLKYYIGKVKSEDNLDIPLLAEKGKGFTAADINNMVREAGLLAMRESRDTISQADLVKALERVLISVEAMGENKILGGKVNVKWSDVIGMEDTKEEAWELVKMLKDRNIVKAVGGRIVKGVVMFGPPGCGKTYLAKAMATESGFPFISATGSDLVGIYVGEGAHKMKEIFKEARSLAKSEGGCIIFFD